MSGWQISFCAQPWLPDSPLCSAGLLGKAADRFGWALFCSNYSTLIKSWPSCMTKAALIGLHQAFIRPLDLDYINVKEAKFIKHNIHTYKNVLQVKLKHNIICCCAGCGNIVIWNLWCGNILKSGIYPTGSYELACLPLFCDRREGIINGQTDITTRGIAKRCRNKHGDHRSPQNVKSLSNDWYHSVEQHQNIL